MLTHGALYENEVPQKDPNILTFRPSIVATQIVGEWKGYGEKLSEAPR